MDFRLIRHGVVDSSSERAFAAIEDGSARHGDVHLAHGQTAGRGRRGRGWFSAPGEGLYLSLVLLPDPPPLKPTALTVATALAVLEGITDLGLPTGGPLAPRLKWPNDVLVGEAKLCGILTESRTHGSRPPHFVVGIGLNLHQRRFPDALTGERAVTSLALLGLEIDVELAAAAVLGRLRVRLGQVRNRHRLLAADYLAASGLGGRRVRIRSGNDEATGILRDLTLAEGLELRDDAGRTAVLPLEFVRSVEVLGEG